MGTQPTQPSISDLRTLPHYSYSAMEQYLSCSLAYFFRYIRRIESSRTSKCLVFGIAFHRTLDRIAARRMDGGLSINVAEAQGIFSGEWEVQLAKALEIDFETKDEPAIMEEQGRQMLAAYLAAWKPNKVIAHARAFVLPLCDDEGNTLSKPIVGEFDLIEEIDGVPTIVDFKTAARKWTDAKLEHDLQSSLYCLAYWKETGQLPRFRFDITTKSKIPTVHQADAPRGEDDFRRLTKLYLGIDRAISAGTFLPSGEDYSCASCGYASACKSWHRNTPNQGA